ncbi:MAG: sensor histidine kinase, partial [Blastocatellia bacterium]
YFHAYAPYFKRGQLAGAVEVVEQLDNIPDLVRMYSQSATLIALIAVVLLTVATYLLFRQLIYRPMKQLLYAMARAKAGSLKVQAPVLARDEFGRLSEGFNRMIARIGEMTREREAQQETLRQRVLEATAELQHRNQQLAEANLQLWDVSGRLGEMERLAAAGQTAAQFAHEVGTPLNLISCHVELLRDEMRANPQSAESRTEIITEQIERIERIVRQMMDRTRLEKAMLTPVDLNLLLRRIADATQPKLDSCNVRLKLSLVENLSKIPGAPDYLQQVFINLINNSLDAMPDGGELSIKTFAEHDGRVTVEIADTGCGMSEEVRARIFDPLFTTKER